MSDQKQASLELRALINKFEADGMPVTGIAGLLMTYAIACAVDSGVPLDFVVNEAKLLHAEMTAIARSLAKEPTQRVN